MASPVRANLRAIRESLEKIAGAQGDLRGDRKQAAKKAGETFKSEIRAVTRELGTSVSLSDGKQRTQAALQDLASSYQAVLAPIDCS